MTLFSSLYGTFKAKITFISQYIDLRLTYFPVPEDYH